MNFIKVIYFDESSVTDFMQIIAGGEIKKTTELITNANKDAGAGAQTEAGISTETNGFAKLFSLISGAKFNAEINGHAQVNYKQDRIVKNILENTMLTDFLELLKNDESLDEKKKKCRGINVFKNLNLYPEDDSFTFIMLAAPFFTMLEGGFPFRDDDGNLFNLDISKIKDAMDKGRGYYEFISELNNEEIIFRFNVSALRNNYTLSDLPKMQLTCYAIYVGKANKNKLSIENEFKFGTKDLTRVEYHGNDNDENSNSIDVYDVLLAGVTEKE